jgi:hypothetical protein
MVSRRYAEQLHLDGKPMSASTKNIEAYGKQIDVKGIGLGGPEEDEGVASVKISDLSNEW